MELFSFLFNKELIPYIILSVFIFYFILSFLYRKLPYLAVPLLFGYSYEGSRAVIWSSIFLIISFFAMDFYLTENSLSFNFDLFYISLLFGLPLGFILYKFISLCTFFMISIPGNDMRPRTKRAIIEWTIAGIFIAPFLTLLVFLATSSLLLTIATFLLIVIFVALWGSATKFY